MGTKNLFLSDGRMNMPKLIGYLCTRIAKFDDAKVTSVFSTCFDQFANIDFVHGFKDFRCHVHIYQDDDACNDIDITYEKDGECHIIDFIHYLKSKLESIGINVYVNSKTEIKFGGEENEN